MYDTQFLNANQSLLLLQYVSMNITYMRDMLMSVFRLLVFSCLRTVILLRMYNLKKRRPSIWDRARDLSLKKMLNGLSLKPLYLYSYYLKYINPN